jgi:ribosomal protein S4E
VEVKIDFSASGDNTILAAAAGFRYKIRQMFLVPGGDTTIQIKSGSNVLVGGMSLKANMFVVIDVSNMPWVTTNINEALVFNSTAAVQVGGRITLDKEPQ